MQGEQLKPKPGICWSSRGSFIELLTTKLLTDWEYWSLSYSDSDYYLHLVSGVWNRADEGQLVTDVLIEGMMMKTCVHIIHTNRIVMYSELTE